MSVVAASQTLIDAYVGLGSNLAVPCKQVRDAIGALGDIESTAVTACSSLYRSAPIGFEDQPDFVNAVARLSTLLGAGELLDALLAIEIAQGRQRSFRNAPRTLDLDLLLYGEQCFDAPGLSIPHPRMHERAFVLVPLAQIAPAIVIPGKGPVHALLARVESHAIERIAE